MTPLETIQSMKLPFAELKGVTFTSQRRIAWSHACWSGHLCTLNTCSWRRDHGIRGFRRRGATVINLPRCQGTTTLESKTNFISGAKEGPMWRDCDAVHRAGAPRSGRPAGDRGRKTRGGGHQTQMCSYDYGGAASLTIRTAPARYCRGSVLNSMVRCTILRF